MSKYDPVPGKIPGAALNISGVDLIAAPFNLDGVQEAEKLLGDLQKIVKPADLLNKVAQLLHVSLRRNYPDMSVEEVAKLVDMGNWQSAIATVISASGMETTKPGEMRPASP